MLTGQRSNQSDDRHKPVMIELAKRWLLPERPEPKAKARPGGLSALLMGAGSATLPSGATRRG